ncbi:OmpW/AlkL family protein [Acidisoma sp. C75]
MLTMPPLCHAQSTGGAGGFHAGDWLVRLRLVGIIPDHGGTPISPLGGNFENDNLATPELDLSHFFTRHLAIEGEVGVFRENIRARNTVLGTLPVGTVEAAPVLLLGQFHALPDSLINPYIGIGFAVVPYFDAEPAGGLVQQLSVQTEVGAVFQLGADLHLGGPWFANLDVKKLVLPAVASVNHGGATSSGQVNPWILGGGIGYRF